MGYSAEIDAKWQKKWCDTGLYKFNKNNVDKKLYCLEMFSYPSGSKLHAGHWFNFAPSDSWARMKRMQGYEVFEPMGFDAFGLPAENYAIKTGVHPQDSTYKNIDTMRNQLQELGAMYDWNHEVITCSPEYYRWTQWLFLQLYKAGLAYRKKAPVNWCPSCNTVLANEQVVQGECERCSSLVTKEDLTQWFFKITAYADELIDKLKELDWPERTKKVQQNWIGRSVGAEVKFKIEGSNQHELTVFTTRADTLYGVTYIAIAPEHSVIDYIVSDNHKSKVLEYKEKVKAATEIERLSTERAKTGVFTGAYARHPMTGDSIPIWVCDYVLGSYGTGCVMAVPAHDARDFAFAKKYQLPIVQVVSSPDFSELPYLGTGKLINSQEFDGLITSDAATKIIKALEGRDSGGFAINYRLRDWLVSRQRYWGCPIPIVHCNRCGVTPVPEEDLPVKLPYNVVFTNDGESPLKKDKEFLNTVCPSCGDNARRDTDTLDTFVDSAWYYLRYPDNKNDAEAFDRNFINKMLPVDKYIGGPEHAAMHLLYARFLTKALRDLGYLNFDEPFVSLIHQGIILGPDGNKMSKSKGNTVSPDDYVKKYGSDVFRMSLMFGFAFVEGGPWNDSSLRAISKFVGRVERLIAERNYKISGVVNNFAEKELNYKRHLAIKGVGEDIERFQFNTAISKLMEFLNAIVETKDLSEEFLEEVLSDFVKLLAPLAPHLSEELWQRLGKEYSVFNHEWPIYDKSKLTRDNVELAVQINGAIRCRIQIPSSLKDVDVIKEMVLSDNRINNYIEGKQIKKVIVVPKRLVNIVL